MESDVSGDVSEKETAAKTSDMECDDTDDWRVRRLGIAPGSRGDSGPQTTWIGLQRVHDFAQAWNTFDPGAKNNEKDV